METKLIALLAFGASVMTLWAWLTANFSLKGSDPRKPDSHR